MTDKATVKKRPRSSAFEAIHSAATGLHKVGAIDKKTMREFDEACLMPVPTYTGNDVKRIRTKIAKVSQTVFAVYMNTSVSAVQKWEQDNRPVQGPAARLLNIVERSGSLEAIA